MAILALAALRIERHQRIARIAVVLTARVALLTQARPRNLQQEVVVGAVRIVTVQAALGYGRMLPQERSAFFCMTLPANFVDGRRLQQIFRIAAVRIVAVGANDLPFAHGDV